MFRDADWKEWKQRAKKGNLSREERIKNGKFHLESKYRVLVNEHGRVGRYVVEREKFKNKEIETFSTTRRVFGGTSVYDNEFPSPLYFFIW